MWSKGHQKLRKIKSSGSKLSFFFEHHGHQSGLYETNFCNKNAIGSSSWLVGWKNSKYLTLSFKQKSAYCSSRRWLIVIFLGAFCSKMIVKQLSGYQILAHCPPNNAQLDGCLILMLRPPEIVMKESIGVQISPLALHPTYSASFLDLCSQLLWLRSHWW